MYQHFSFFFLNFLFLLPTTSHTIYFLSLSLFLISLSIPAIYTYIHAHDDVILPSLLTLYFTSIFFNFYSHQFLTFSLKNFFSKDTVFFFVYLFTFHFILVYLCSCRSFSVSWFAISVLEDIFRRCVSH